MRRKNCSTPMAAYEAFIHIIDSTFNQHAKWCSFNFSFSDAANSNGRAGWTSPYHFGINVGQVMLMCENHRSDFLWRLMRACPCVVAGLRRAGFSNGWL